MLKISANDAQLTVVACGPITSDRIDLPCEITLSKEFDGLAVTVVFKAGDVQRDVAMLGSPVHVPAECLEQAGEVLMVGIWAGDGSGRPTIPTVWASAGTIRTGVLPSGYDPDEPEPDWAAQVQQAAAQAVETANSVREDADAGVFDGEDGYSPSATVEQLADGATITITDKDGTTTATVHDGADGRDGRDGTDGVDGYSPTATVTQTASGATITITDKSGTTTASVSNGTDGADGTDGFSPTVDVQPVTGGHEVTITDADGVHSFDVMDGDPAEPGSITDAMLAPDGIKPQVAQLFGNQLVGELSGTIDTASDAYAAPPMALTVGGASTQAGTPTPDAPVPILSVDDLALEVHGKNIWRYWKSAYINNSGAITTTANNGLCYPIHVSAGDVFTFSRTSGQSGYAVVANDGAVVQRLGAAGASYTLTVQGDGLLYVWIPVTDVTEDLAYEAHPQLELGSTATAYEPYQGQTVPNLLPEGTSLRSLPDGTHDQLNLSYLRPSTRAGWAWYGREVTRNVVAVDLGTLTWVKESNNRVFDVRVYNALYNANSVMCNQFSSSPVTAQQTMPDNSIGMTNGQARCLLAVKSAYYFDTMDAAQFEAAMSGVMAYYRRLTPTTETLPEIELPELPAPTCTVFCDGGSATPTYQMQYVRDTTLVIQALEAAIADLATS